MTIQTIQIDTDTHVVVPKGALIMVVNALRRDAAEGKHIRGEMADELLNCPQPEQAQQPATPNVQALVEALQKIIEGPDDEWAVNSAEDNVRWTTKIACKALAAFQQGGRA